MGYRLGVDLGTTWTAAAVFDGTVSTPLRLGTAGVAIPSAVAVDGDQFLIGEPASKRVTLDPLSGAREMKRRLGDSTPFVLNGTPYSPESLLGRILAAVVTTAEEQSGPADAVVLTHPATWGAFKIDLLTEVARVAGLSIVDLVAEPVAAASHYAQLGKVPSGSTIAVYDFGGGTFDAAIVRDGDNGLELAGPAEGLDRLGGVDFDQAVLAHVLAALDGQLDDLDRNDPAVRTAMASLRDEVVAAKEALSSDSDASISVQFPTISTQIRMTRSEFETAIRPRVQETLDALDRTLAAAGLQYESLHSILLVGGSSRIPLVAEMVGAHTGRLIATDVDTKAAVCCGAASWNATALGTTPGAVVAEQASTTGSPETAAKATSGPSRIGTTARQVGRAAAIGGAAVAGTAAIATGAAAAYAATQDDDPQSSTPRSPTPVAKEHSATEASQTGGASEPNHDAASDSQPSAAHTASPHAGATESASLDAFDEITAAPSPQPSHAEPGRSLDDGVRTDSFQQRAHEQTTDDAATAEHLSQQPDAMEPSSGAPSGAPSSMPGMPPQHNAPPSNNDEQVLQVQQALRAHLESWQPPAGATEQEVHDLKAELEGLIDRFDPADGVSFENAAGDLQQRLDSSLQDFSQSEQLDRIREAQQGAQATAQQAAATRAEFKEYTDALEDFAQDWDPTWPNWVDQASLAKFKEQDIPGLLATIRFNPDAPLRIQQERAEAAVRSSLDKWQQAQYDHHHAEQSAQLADEAQRLEFIARDMTATPEARSQAASDLDLVHDQIQLNNALARDAAKLPVVIDPASEAALHQHLAPAPPDMDDAATEMSVDGHAALLDAIREDADQAITETSVSHSALIADVFDYDSDSADDDQLLAAIATPAARAFQPPVVPTMMQTQSVEPPQPDTSDDLSSNDLLNDDVLGTVVQLDPALTIAAVADDTTSLDAIDATPDDAFATLVDTSPTAALLATDLNDDVTEVADNPSPLLDDPTMPVVADDDVDDNQSGF